MKELQSGDRVRVFNVDDSGNEDVETAVVARVEDQAVWVKCKNISGEEFEWPYHRKQLRKLVAKERLRVWISASAFSSGVSSHKYVALEPSLTDGIEFIEVKRKAKQ